MFGERTKKIREATDSMTEVVRGEIGRMLEELDEAGNQHAELNNLVGAQRESIELLQTELARVSENYEAKIGVLEQDFQERLDALEAENLALRNRLKTKDNNFGVLSRAVNAMILAGRQINAIGTHAQKTIAGDATADNIVAHLRGAPPRRRSSITESLGEPIPPERASAG